MNGKKIVVIGSGISGMTSLIKLKESGYSPILIRKGAGAGAMFSGAFDIASIVPYKENMSLKKEINLLKELNEYHPYNKSKDVLSTLKKAFSLINDNLKLNLTVLDFDRENFILPLQSGNFKKTALMNKNEVGINLSEMLYNEKKYGILNFTLFKYFNHENLLFELNDLKEKFNSSSEFLIINFDFLRRSSDVNLKSFDLAKIIQRDDLYKEIASKINELACKNDIDTIISPPVWGIEKADEIKNWFLKNDIKIYETLGDFPSVYGIRLLKKTEAYLKENNIETIDAKVIGYASEKGYLKKLRLSDGSQIDVSAVILATGKFTGGGLSIDSEIKETVFGLPVFYENNVVNTKDNMFEIDYFKKHKVFSFGLKTNKRFQPLDENDKVVFKNLFAAGNILADYNYIFREGGMGVAVFSGYEAAKYLSQIV